MPVLWYPCPVDWQRQWTLSFAHINYQSSPLLMFQGCLSLKTLALIANETLVRFMRLGVGKAERVLTFRSAPATTCPQISTSVPDSHGDSKDCCRQNHHRYLGRCRLFSLRFDQVSHTNYLITERIKSRYDLSDEPAPIS